MGWRGDRLGCVLCTTVGRGKFPVPQGWIDAWIGTEVLLDKNERYTVVQLLIMLWDMS